jgi:hypothetical protein
LRSPILVGYQVPWRRTRNSYQSGAWGKTLYFLMLLMCTAGARSFALPMLLMCTSRSDKFQCHFFVGSSKLAMCLGFLDGYCSDLNFCIAETITIVVGTRMTLLLYHLSYIVLA